MLPKIRAIEFDSTRVDPNLARFELHGKLRMNQGAARLLLPGRDIELKTVPGTGYNAAAERAFGKRNQAAICNSGAGSGGPATIRRANAGHFRDADLGT